MSTQAPVEERIGPITATVHRVQAADGVELAVTRLSAERAAACAPVVLMHGSYCQRSFFVSPRGIGLGPYLLEQGFDVWIPELRGHGRSPKGRRFRSFTAEDQLQHDAPAVQRLVADRTGHAAHWLGHSWGGTVVVGALAMGWLERAAVASVVTLGTQITEGDTYLKGRVSGPLLKALVWGLGGVPARLLGLGPEPESPAYVRDFFRWKGRGGRWATPDGESYWDGLRGLDVPLLAFAAPNDKNDPASGCRTLFDAVGSSDKRFVLLSIADGYSADYEHVEMIVSKAAQAEVYPLIAGWLGERTGAP